MGKVNFSFKMNLNFYAGVVLSHFETAQFNCALPTYKVHLRND